MKISKLLLALCALTLAQESLAMDSDGNRPGWDKDSNGGTYPTWPFSPDYTPRDEPSQPTSSSPSTTISSGPTIDPSNPINQAWIQARNGVTVTKGYVPSNAKPTVVSGVSILSGRTPETVKACERETAEYLKDRENLAKKNTELREKIKGAIFELDRRAAVSLQLSTGRWDVKDATRIAGVLCGLDELNTLAGQYTNPELAAEMANSPSGNQEAYRLSGESLRASLEYLAEMSRSVETPEAFAEKQGLFAFAKATGEVLLDLATSLTPGVSAGRDAYEAFTGKSLLTQVDLTPFERSVAVLCVASLGTGSILKGALKGVERIAGLARAGHRVEVAEHAIKDAVAGAEKIIEGVGGKITGYTRHGLNRVISRDEGRGVSISALLNAVKNPQQVVNQANGAVQYVGTEATVILNSVGKVITAFGKPRG